MGTEEKIDWESYAKEEAKINHCLIYGQFLRLTQRVEKLEIRTSQLEEENCQLEEKIERLKGDSEDIEYGVNQLDMAYERMM